MSLDSNNALMKCYCPKEMSFVTLTGSYGTIFILVVAAIQLPRYLINIFDLPFPQFGEFFPTLGPVVICILAGVFYYRLGCGSNLIVFRSQDALMFIGLLLGFCMELSYPFHGVINSYALLLPFFWFIVFYIALRELEAIWGANIPILSCLFFGMTVLVIVHVGLNIWLKIIPGSAKVFFDISEIRDRNGLAAQSVIALWLIFFHPQIRKRWTSVFLAIAALFHISNVVINHSRGAAFLTMCLLTLWGLCLIGVKRSVILLVGSIILIVGAISLTPNFKKNILLQYENIGVGHEMSLKQSRELPNATVSSYSRFQSFFQTYEIFASNPIVGSGSMAVKEVRVLGYPCHSFVVMILAAYGIIISSMMTTGIILALSEGRRFGKVLTLSGGLLLLLLLLLDNALCSWHAIIPFALSVKQP